MQTYKGSHVQSPCISITLNFEKNWKKYQKPVFCITGMLLYLFCCYMYPYVIIIHHFLTFFTSIQSVFFKFSSFTGVIVVSFSYYL